MSTRTLKSFDQYADQYRELLDRSISITGESGGYFCRGEGSVYCGSSAFEFNRPASRFGCGVGMLSHLA
jgi:hypothetical protein